MDGKRTPIGGTHSRDFGELKQQRQLSELRADERGYVRFRCLKCPRTGKVELAKLKERFAPDAGLVDILNTLLPVDCAKTERDPWGHVACGFCYRDLGGPNG